MSLSTEHALTNRHVETTRAQESLSDAEVCFDYFGITLPDSIPLKDAMVLVSGTSDWEEQEHGTAGYSKSARWGEWVCSWGGTRGIHFEGAGKACRQIEEQKGHDWVSWLGTLRGVGASFSRVDGAWDVRSGVCSMSEVRRAVASGHVVTRARARKEIESWVEGGAECHGVTVYIGSGRSEKLLRLYDKAAQLNLPGTWVRVELQLRHGSADKAIGMWLDAAQKERDRLAGGGKWSGVRAPEGSALGGVSEARTVGGAAVAASDGLAAGFQCLAGVLKGFVSFRRPFSGSMDTVVRRWPEADWWGRLMRGIEACKVVINKAPRSLDQVRDWVEHAVVGSLAMLVEAEGGDLGVLSRLYFMGKGKMTLRHRQMLVAAGIET